MCDLVQIIVLSPSKNSVHPSSQSILYTRPPFPPPPSSVHLSFVPVECEQSDRKEHTRSTFRTKGGLFFFFHSKEWLVEWICLVDERTSQAWIPLLPPHHSHRVFFFFFERLRGRCRTINRSLTFHCFFFLLRLPFRSASLLSTSPPSSSTTSSKPTPSFFTVSHLLFSSTFGSSGLEGDVMRIGIVDRRKKSPRPRFSQNVYSFAQWLDYHVGSEWFLCGRGRLGWLAGWMTRKRRIATRKRVLCLK